VNGPNSPNNTLQRFDMNGADLGIMWDNGDPFDDQVLIAFGDTFGYCGVPGQHRDNTLFRSQDRSLAHGIDVADGSPFDTHSGSPERQPGFSKQIINKAHPGANGGGDHSDRRHRRRQNPIGQLHVRQVMGEPWPMDDELLGNRDVPRQWPELVDLPRNRPHARGRQHGGRPVRPGK